MFIYQEDDIDFSLEYVLEIEDCANCFSFLKKTVFWGRLGYLTFFDMFPALHDYVQIYPNHVD